MDAFDAYVPTDDWRFPVIVGPATAAALPSDTREVGPRDGVGSVLLLPR